MRLLFRKFTNQIASVLDDLPQGVCLFDAEGRLVVANKRYVEMYGMSPGIVVRGCTLRDLVTHRKALGVISADVDVYCSAVLADIALGKTTSRSIELADGRTVHQVNRPLVDGGWIATHEDITERKAAEEKLAQEINENRRLFETSLDLILVTNRFGLIERVSPSVFSILGYAPDEMVGSYGSDFVYPDDLDDTRAEMRLARSGRHMRNFETRYLHKNGKVITLVWSGVWSEPEQKHFFTGRDVSEKKIFEQKLSHLAHFDPLTGLANRLSLQSDLEQALCSCPTSIAIFDLDGFKDINDTLGHSIGDNLLQSVAARMRDFERDGVRFYRLGGDEFVLVHSDCGDPRIVGQSVTKTLRRLQEKFEVAEHTLFVGASAGIAIAPVDGNNVEELMSSADLALYDAKAAGGNTFRLFVPALRAKASARRELDAELRRACADKEFELYFQPQVRADNGALVGAEALLRWRHPGRGVLAPGAFIDALSESPVVLEVGRWILSAACEQAARWRIAGLSDFRIGVNLFPAQFHAKTLCTDVEAALHATRLPAHALEIEITENIALGEQQENLDAVRALREKGVNFAFDDFGTGYASLSYLTRYPLSRLKIDQSFVRKISEGSSLENTAIVRSIIAMAHNLGLEVIAEGVENELQAAFLRKEKCEELQGYLYGKPMPAREFEARYLSNSTERPRSRDQIRA
jgi:diguanylate cyclase (GGDEF)-like protein/PAS domain S-box-containing protein